jgi:hypothetical protein
MKWLDDKNPIEAVTLEYFRAESFDAWAADDDRGDQNWGALYLKNYFGGDWGLFYRDGAVEVVLLDKEDSLGDFEDEWNERNQPDTRERDIPSVGARNRIVNGRIM